MKLNYNMCYSIFIGMFFLLVTQEVMGANILGISPWNIPSHYNVIQPVYQELVKRGHKVTILTTLKDDFKLPNYNPIKIGKFEAGKLLIDDNEKIDPFKSAFGSIVRKAFLVFDLTYKLTEVSLDSIELQNFIHNDNSHFDLILCEEFNMSPYFMFAHKYNAPLVTFITYSNAHYVNDFMGNPLNLHYVPHELMESVVKLSLWDKIENIFITLISKIARDYYYLPKHNELAKKHFGHLESLPDLRDMEKNISLVFVNTHFSLGVVRPYLPNIVEFGGVHVKEPKPLSQELQSIMDSAANGVIYFSMGSSLKSKDMPEEKIKVLLKVFSSLKETILWKWEDEILPGKPKNVIIRKWFPQSDILAHPNLKLFITHGGLLSTIESIYRGVPLLGIPIQWDQPANIEKARSFGYAESVDYDKMNVDDLKSVIEKLLNDPKYMSKAKELSNLVHDKPMTAMENTMFWIEYVIRHKGAYHMKSPSSFMRWYEYYLVDVAVVLGSLFILLLFTVFLSIRFILNVACGERKRKNISEKKLK